MPEVWNAIFLVLFIGVAVWSSLISRRVSQLEERLRQLEGSQPGQPR